MAVPPQKMKALVAKQAKKPAIPAKYMAKKKSAAEAPSPIDGEMQKPPKGAAATPSHASGTPPAKTPPPRPGSPKVPPQHDPSGAPPPGHEAAPAPGSEEVSPEELVETAAQGAEAMSDPEVEDAMASFQPQPPGEDGLVPPPDFALTPELWDEAVNLVQPDSEDAQARYEEPWMVVAYLYKNLGGEFAPPPEIKPEDAAAHAAASPAAPPPGHDMV